MSKISPQKRALESIERTVSPPPQRRKFHVSEAPDHVEVEHRPEVTPDLIKVLSWNVNGVTPFLQKRLDAPTVYPLRSKLERHGWPHVCCLQEVKINPKDIATQRRLQNAANDGRQSGEPIYEIAFSLPRDAHQAKGFGGKVHGVASLTRKDFQHAITSTRRPDWDLEGRILIHETTLGFVLINGYWVNGTSAPWYNSVGKPEGTRHELKIRYHSHILDEVLHYQRLGIHVVLVGDMNVALDKRDGHPRLRTTPIQHVKNREDFNQKFFFAKDGMKGVDVFRQVHDDQRKYTFYSTYGAWGSSCDRVDHIIVSRSLVNMSAIVDCDICNTREDAGHSDHCPLWATIDISKIQATSEISTIPQDEQK